MAMQQDVKMMPQKKLFPHRYSVWAVASLLAFQAPQAHADEPSMRFTFQREDYRKYGLGLYQVIHANGTITDGTYDRLKIFAQENNIHPGGEIYLNSQTGNRLEGMRIGRLIRSLGLMTHIGNTNPNQPGACVSACAFAYLGGTYRFMGPTSTFGVHRFYRSQGKDQEFTIEESDAVSVQMTDYIRDMGADTHLFKYMTANTAGETVLISKATLQSLKVVNDGVSYAAWGMTDDTVPYLRGELNDYNGSHSLSLKCDRQSATLQGTAIFETSNPEALRLVAQEEGVVIGDSNVPMAGTLVSDNKKTLTYSFPIPQDIAKRMATAPELGVYIKPNGIIYNAGFQLQQNMESQAKMKKFFNYCFGGRI